MVRTSKCEFITLTVLSQRCVATESAALPNFLLNSRTHQHLRASKYVLLQATCFLSCEKMDRFVLIWDHRSWKQLKSQQSWLPRGRLSKHPYLLVERLGW